METKYSLYVIELIAFVHTPPPPPPRDTNVYFW